MPQVPTKTLGTVETKAFQPVYQRPVNNPDAFGAAQARAYAQVANLFQNIAGTTGDIAMDMREDDVVRQTQEAALKFDTEKAQIVGAYFALRGEDAVKQADDYHKQLTKLRDKYSSIKDKAVADRIRDAALERRRKLIGEPVAQ